MNARLDAALAHWSYVAPLLTPAANEDDYRALVESLDAILDAGGADESHPLAGLAAMVGELVSRRSHGDFLRASARRWYSTQLTKSRLVPSAPLSALAGHSQPPSPFRQR